MLRRFDMPSPVIDRVKRTLDFFDALREVASGKSITRIAWDNDDMVKMMRVDDLEGEWLCIRTNGHWGRFAVKDGDIIANDWVTV